MTTELKATLAEHAAGNDRVLMIRDHAHLALPQIFSVCACAGDQMIWIVPASLHRSSMLSFVDVIS